MIKQHLRTCWQVISNPKGFFENIPKADWADKPLTFIGINALIFTFFSTLLIFLNQYIPMGSILIADIKGLKILIILPVLLVLAFCFFMLTFLMAAGCLLAVFLIIFYSTAGSIHLLLKSSGEKEKFFEFLKSTFYSSSVILFGIIPLLALYLVKNGLFTFSHFMIIYNIVYLISVLYLFRLLSFAAERIYASAKLKILMVALVPILIMIIAGAIFGLKVLPKLAPLIA